MSRHFPYSLPGLLAGFVLLFSSAGLAQDVTAYTGATVIDGVSNTAVSNATIVVRGGKIVDIGNVSTPAGATVVDLNGRYVMPGLIDAHVHISDFAAARRALTSGVTTARSGTWAWGS